MADRTSVCNRAGFPDFFTGGKIATTEVISMTCALRNALKSGTRGWPSGQTPQAQGPTLEFRKARRAWPRIARGKMSGCGQGDDPGLMSAGADEGDEIGRGNGRRRVIGERVIVEEGLLHHALLEDDGDAVLRVVDEAEGRDGARLDAQQLHQEIGLA